MGIAIPHAKTQAVKKPCVAVGISKQGFEFDSDDGKPVHLIFMIAARDGDGNLHLQTLAKLSGKLMDEDFVEQIKARQNSKELLKLLEKSVK